MIYIVKIILDMFIEIYGNQIEVVRCLLCYCNIVRCYLYDKEVRYYVIVNGVLMIYQGGRGIYDCNQY